MRASFKRLLEVRTTPDPLYSALVSVSVSSTRTRNRPADPAVSAKSGRRAIYSSATTSLALVWKDWYRTCTQNHANRAQASY